MQAQGITGIVIVPDLGPSPARVSHRTGIIEFSAKFLKILPKEHIKFVLLHEMGHIMAATHSEIKADEWAFNKYIEMGGSLSASVKALTSILSGENPEHNLRMYLQLQRAIKYDREVNGNTNI